MAKDKAPDKDKDKKGQKPAAQEAKAPAEAARHSAKETPRLKQRFLKEVAPVADEGIGPQEPHGSAASA